MPQNRSRHRRTLLAAAGLLAPLAALPAVLSAADRRAGPADKPGKPAPVTRADGLADQANQVTGNEITDAQKACVKRGLAWLAKKQADTKNFGQVGYTGHAGITALAGVAFMQAGNLPGRGEYGKEVQNILDYVLANCTRSGLIASDNSSGPMYGHGFATLFLGEVYGMTGNEEVKEKLQRAVQLIQKSQNAEGGWRYQPQPIDADISVTICQVMALRAARDAGIKVEKEVIDKSIEYVKRCQNFDGDGGFNYMSNQGGGGSAFPRSAAGVAALYYAGEFKGENIKRGLEYVKRFTPTPNGGGGERAEGHYFYGHYYAVQANFLAGGEYWANWYPAIRDELINRQDKATGAWSGDFSEEYATSMALIILQMPNRYLPVYAGKGPGT
jgi:hypothetical protein